jgi:hypothetical protein
MAVSIQAVNGIRMKLKHSKKRCYQRPVPQAKPAFDAGKKRGAEAPLSPVSKQTA